MTRAVTKSSHRARTRQAASVLAIRRRPVHRRRATRSYLLAQEARRRFSHLPADHRLIVDLFAGGGGASLGIEQALGRGPDVAINHDAEAVAMHAANHPATWHVLSDVWEVEPSSVTAGRPVGLLWASPDCKHFSKAKGGQPVKRRIRALAWVVIKWAKAVRPDVIMLENVEEFATWGPLVQKVDAFGAKVFDLHGSPVMVPCKKRKGETFHRWRRQLERLGYRFEWRERRACNAGAGTIRKRLYSIARRDGQPIVWPAATHGDPKKPLGALKPWVTAADSIDWSLVCPSIFDTAEEIKARHGIRAQRPLRPKTMARIAKGVFRYVINSAAPFIVPVTHAGDIRVNPIDEPLRTGTAAKRGEHALVQPFIAGVGGRTGQGHTQTRPASEPMQTATVKEDAVVVTPFVTKFNGGSVGKAASEPLPTCTAHSSETHPGGYAPLGVVAPYLVRTDMTSAFERNGVNSAEEPARTFMTANSHAVVAPLLVRTAHGDVDQRGHRRGRGDLAATDPFTAGGAAPSLVAATMVKSNHGDKPHYAVDEPTRTFVAGGNHHALVAAHLSAYYGEGEGSDDRAASAGEPLRTVPTENRHAVVAAFLAQHNYMEPGHAPTEPVSTIVGKGCNQTVVQAELQAAASETPALQAAAGIVNLKGSGADQLMPRPVDAPTPTSTAQGRHVAEVRAFLVKFYQGGGQSQDAREPLHTATVKPRFGIVTVAGVDYQIVDIGMRMLTARERFNANGFPRDYKIDVIAEKTVRGRRVRKPLSLEAQGRMVGNSVCPPEARALAAANCAHLAISGPRQSAIPAGG